MFLLTALVELLVLRRRCARWNIPPCIISVAAFSGIVWLLNWMLMNWGEDTPEMAPSDAFDWMCVGISIVLYLLAFTVAALIPAGLTAFIYRKHRSIALKR